MQGSSDKTKREAEITFQIYKNRKKWQKGGDRPGCSHQFEMENGRFREQVKMPKGQDAEEVLRKLEEKAIRLNPKGDVFRLYSKTH